MTASSVRLLLVTAAVFFGTDAVHDECSKLGGTLKKDVIDEEMHHALLEEHVASIDRELLKLDLGDGASNKSSTHAHPLVGELPSSVGSALGLYNIFNKLAGITKSVAQWNSLAKFTLGNNLMRNLDSLRQVHDVLVGNIRLEPRSWEEACEGCSDEELDKTFQITLQFSLDGGLAKGLHQFSPEGCQFRLKKAVKVMRQAIKAVNQECDNILEALASTSDPEPLPYRLYGDRGCDGDCEGCERGNSLNFDGLGEHFKIPHGFAEKTTCREVASGSRVEVADYCSTACDKMDGCKGFTLYNGTIHHFKDRTEEMEVGDSVIIEKKGREIKFKMCDDHEMLLVSAPPDPENDPEADCHEGRWGVACGEKNIGCWKSDDLRLVRKKLEIGDQVRVEKGDRELKFSKCAYHEIVLSSTRCTEGRWGLACGGIDLGCWKSENLRLLQKKDYDDVISNRCCFRTSVQNTYTQEATECFVRPVPDHLRSKNVAETSAWLGSLISLPDIDDDLKKTILQASKAPVNGLALEAMGVTKFKEKLQLQDARSSSVRRLMCMVEAARFGEEASTCIPQGFFEYYTKIHGLIDPAIWWLAKTNFQANTWRLGALNKIIGMAKSYLDQYDWASKAAALSTSALGFTLDYMFLTGSISTVASVASAESFGGIDWISVTSSAGYLIGKAIDLSWNQCWVVENWLRKTELGDAAKSDAIIDAAMGGADCVDYADCAAKSDALTDFVDPCLESSDCVEYDDGDEGLDDDGFDGLDALD